MEGRRVQAFEGRTPGSFILHCGDGFHYHIRETRGRRIRLRCRHTSCVGTARVSLETGLLYHLQPHNHAADLLLSEDMELRRAMIREAETDVYGRTMTNILNEFKIRCGNPALAMRFTSVRMLSALREARSSQYPNIPKTLLQLGLLLGLPDMQRVCTTVDGTDYIFRGVVGCLQGKTVALVFVSGRMLRFLGTLENIHADGTFKKRSRKPKMSQIFNIITKFGDNIVAVVRVLMMSRTTPAYTEVLQYLKRLAPNWAPRRIYCDYERAEMNAFKLAFPMSRVVGCLWHYAVAVSSKAKKLGFTPLAKDNPMVHSFIRCLASAPLLPMHLIWTGVLELWNEVVESGWEQQFLPLFQYFEREWMPRLTELSVFGVVDRTNNCSESDNHTIKNFVPQNYPNTWHLIGAFVKLEYLAYCSVVALQAGRALTRGPGWKTVWNNEQVRRASQLLMAQQISPGAFLLQASHANHAPVNHGLHLREESDSEDSDSEDSDEETDDDD